MRYALVAGQSEEARPNSSGICRHCREPVIAKCGDRRVRHWAHLGGRTCDVWWEPETDWHRKWKDHFPSSWQEVIHAVPDGEKHIADVKTSHGLTLEFQYSFLDREERRSREAFYRNIVWVVSGKRRKRDRARFFDAIASWWQLSPAIFTTSFVEDGLPAEWLSSSAPVYFDFGDSQPNDPIQAVRPVLWCLLPQRVMGKSVVVAVVKAEFVSACLERATILDEQEILNTVLEKVRRLRLIKRIEYSAQRPSWRSGSQRRLERHLPSL